MRIAITVLLLSFFGAVSEAQVWDKTRDRTKEKTQERTERNAEEGIDRGLDKIEDGIKNIFKKKDKKSKSDQDGTNASGAHSTGPNDTKTDGQGNTDYSAFKNFDFIPGENILFFDDFSNGLNLWNRVTWDEGEEKHKGMVTTSGVAPGNWYYMPRKGMTAPKSLGALPNQFTLEFDFFYDENHTEHEGGINTMFVKENGFDINNYDFYFERNTRLGLDIHPAGKNLYLKGWREYGYSDGIDGGEWILRELIENYLKTNQVYRMSISRNGSHVKLYINQDKVIDLPNAFPANESYTFMLGNNSWISGLYVSNVRLATGAPQPAKEIRENKAFITQNIHFDVNSDIIKANSYQILNEIAQSLKQVSSTILIVGHTDSDGSAEHNLTLSQKRAASVKRALVNEFGLDANRLITDGKGLTQPLNGNRNASEKAENRRVEFIQQNQ
ncbi:outer membrane protein OmpA-like peptidoglycan-associated protein [Algoriphagus sp. 4150]|nr:outer membrane protein OmpA-like peptidoglycan-associated protein [Algoriphagus sp. 4150]